MELSYINLEIKLTRISIAVVGADMMFLFYPVVFSDLIILSFPSSPLFLQGRLLLQYLVLVMLSSILTDRLMGGIDLSVKTFFFYLRR